MPPLVTTSPAASGGVLEAPGTTVLFGGSRLDEDAHSGGRFTVGGWLNECQTIGVDGDYFFLGSRSVDFTAGSNGLPGSQLLARPVVNAITGMETAEIIASPGTVAGNVHVTSSSRLEGAGTNVLANLCCTRCSRVDLFAGFRYLELARGNRHYGKRGRQPGCADHRWQHLRGGGSVRYAQPVLWRSARSARSIAGATSLWT